MKVSVLIHNLNRAGILQKCLASVAAQGYRPLEVIILDAGSTDDSLSVISRMSSVMTQTGIAVHSFSCPPMGVAASRNLAAGKACGDLFFVIDNDATFAAPDTIGRTVAMFGAEENLAIVTARIVAGDSEEQDPSTWVYRRPKREWSHRRFRTFTFTGGGFCARSRAFHEAGGFWEHLRFSREEEDLALVLIDQGWELVYAPDVVVRHYPAPREHPAAVLRRYVELRNGLLILWRRLPLLLALMAIGGRITTMAVKMMVREKVVPHQLLRTVAEAGKEWRESSLERSPISLGGVVRYISLHFQR